MSLHKICLPMGFCPHVLHKEICRFAPCKSKKIPLQYFLLSTFLFITSFSVFYFPFFNSSTYECLSAYRPFGFTRSSKYLVAMSPTDFSFIPPQITPTISKLTGIYINDFILPVMLNVSSFWVIFCYKPPVHSSGSSLCLQ